MEIITYIIAHIKVGIVPALASLLRDFWLIIKNNYKCKCLNVFFMAFCAGFLAVMIDSLVPDNEWKSSIMFVVGFFIREIFSFLEESKVIIKEGLKKKLKKYLK